MIWVIDASVAMRWFLEDEYHPNADEVLKRIIDKPGYFAVPELFAFEVYSVLYKLHPGPLEAYIEGVVPVLQGGVFRQPMTAELAANADQFIRKGLTGYDACYAALAEQLDGVWLTFDKKAHQCLAGKGLSHLLFDRLPNGW